MVELMVYEFPVDPAGGLNIRDHTPEQVMRLYCWPCRHVHSLSAAEVERLVYALGELVALASGWRDDANIDATDPELCLRRVLKDPPGDHVDQSVVARLGE
jgi:hypothetical protein